MGFFSIQGFKGATSWVHWEALLLGVVITAFTITVATKCCTVVMERFCVAPKTEVARFIIANYCLGVCTTGIFLAAGV